MERYAELVQQLPAPENHHHAHLGGMLDHGLEIVAYALTIRQTYLLPIGAPPESQSAQAETWSAAAAYGALIHDLGKIAVDLQVELQGGKTWHPWHGPINRPYRIRYVKGRDYQLHGAASALIYSQILTPDILDWLCGFPEAAGRRTPLPGPREVQAEPSRWTRRWMAGPRFSMAGEQTHG